MGMLLTEFADLKFVLVFGPELQLIHCYCSQSIETSPVITAADQKFVKTRFSGHRQPAKHLVYAIVTVA